MRYSFTLLLFFFLSLSLVFAQRTKIDSLHNQIRNYSAQDSVKVELLIDLAYRYYQSYPDSTLFFAQKGLTLAERLKYKKGIGRAYNRIAIAYSVKGKYAEALTFYFNSLKIAEQLGDEIGTASALNNIGYILRLQKQYKESFDYTLQALAISQRNQNVGAMAVNLTNLGWLYSNMGDYQKALGFAARGMKMADAIEDNYHASISRHIVAKVYAKQERFDLALVHYQEGLKKAETAQIKQQIAFHLLGLGEIYLIKKQIENAQSNLKKALEIAQEVKSPEIIQEASLALVNLYRSKGEYSKAFEYNDIFNIAKDSIFSLEQQTQINRLQYEFETEKNRREIALLEKDNEYQKAKKELFLNWLYAALGLVFLISILTFSLYRSRQKLWQANRLLAFQKIELEQKNAAIDEKNRSISLQTAQLQEMNKFKDKLFSIIAHDLRNPVMALKNTIDILEPEILHASELVFIKTELLKQFNSMDFTLTNLLEWARSQMKGETYLKENLNLHEIVENAIKLLLPLAQLKEMTICNQIPVSNIVHADLNHVRFIIRNLLNNAIKFTYKQGNITIGVDRKDEQYVIAVRDTGIGISKEEQSKLFAMSTNISTQGTDGEKGTGLGLILCKEFVEKNNGKIWVESEKGQGCTFYFTLPAVELSK
jgi:signal transduction histidine kinase